MFSLIRNDPQTFLLVNVIVGIASAFAFFWYDAGKRDGIEIGLVIAEAESATAEGVEE
jgi:hypothetical protein